MTALDLINDIKTSIRHVAISDKDPEMLKLLNASIRQVYTDVMPSRKSVDITLRWSQSEYKLPDDFIAIADVYDSTGVKRPVNNSMDPLSVFVVDHSHIEVPVSPDGVILTIVYFNFIDDIGLLDEIPFNKIFIPAVSAAVILRALDTYTGPADNNMKQIAYARYKEEVRKLLQHNNTYPTIQYDPIKAGGWI